MDIETTYRLEYIESKGLNDLGFHYHQSNDDLIPAIWALKKCMITWPDKEWRICPVSPSGTLGTHLEFDSPYTISYRGLFTGKWYPWDAWGKRNPAETMISALNSEMPAAEWKLDGPSGLIIQFTPPTGEYVVEWRNKSSEPWKHLSSHPIYLEGHAAYSLMANDQGFCAQVRWRHFNDVIQTYSGVICSEKKIEEAAPVTPTRKISFALVYTQKGSVDWQEYEKYSTIESAIEGMKEQAYRYENHIWKIREVVEGKQMICAF